MATENAVSRLALSSSAENKMPPSVRNVLFICPDNSRASIIAEALLKRWGCGSFQAFSAGNTPTPVVHPMIHQLLVAQRVWRPELKSKSWHEFLRPDAPRMDFIISLGDRAPDGLPSRWPGNPRVMHWRVSEPLGDGTAVESAQAFRRTFTELETRIKLFTLVNTRKSIRRAAA